MIIFIIAMLTVVFSAILWRLGGNGYDLARNPGVPILISLGKLAILYISVCSWWNLLALVYIPALWAMIQAFSYGIDAPIHNFWEWLFKSGNIGTNPKVEIATRCTCGFFWSLPSAIFAYLTGEWMLFGIYVTFLTIINGVIWYYVKDVEDNEPLVGASVACCMII